MRAEQPEGMSRGKTRQLMHATGYVFAASAVLLPFLNFFFLAKLHVISR